MVSFGSSTIVLISKLAKVHLKFRYFQSPNGLIRVAQVVSFFLAIALAYVYVYPSFQPTIHLEEAVKPTDQIGICDFFEGRWIHDQTYPLFNASECPFLERGFDCIANGRRDKDYMKWRWKPKGCDIPRFNAAKVLESLRGKRIVFVGDSLGRTQWESMICLLMTGVENKKTVYEVNGNKISKKIRHLGVRFSSFDLSIDFYRSVFLVQPGPAPKHGLKRVKSTLMLDKLDEISSEWVDSDAIIFNSGHWWTPTKLFEIGCYFQAGGSLKLGMPIMSAFRSALTTWASWAEININTNRTKIFFRTFEPTHWSGSKRKSCKVTRAPSLRTKGKDKSQKSNAIRKVIEKMSVPVTILHVTPMAAFRSDAHVGTWSDKPNVPDCSHWCLPGVPDTWNEILFLYLLSENANKLL